MAKILLKRAFRGVVLWCLIGILLVNTSSSHAQILRRKRVRRAALGWQKHQPWARFDIGAWRKSRTTSQVFDKKGKLKSHVVEETTVTLTKRELLRYTLQYDRVTIVGGKKLVRKPKFAQIGIFGSQKEQVPDVTENNVTKVFVNGKKIDTNIRKIILRGTNQSTRFNVYWNKDLSVFPLRVESAISRNTDETIKSTRLREVVALDMPVSVNMKVISSVVYKTKEKNGKSIATSVEQTSEFVPGGTISLSLKLLDENGQVSGRRSIQLLSYGGTVRENFRVRRRVRR